MAGRFYVYRDGKELTGHPLNGAVWGGSGPYIGRVNGYPVRDLIYVCPKRGAVGVPVRAADAVDAPVMIKRWFPDGDTEWYVFATPEMIAAAGKAMTPAWPDG